MSRHSYPRSFRPVPTWWVVVAALAVLGVFLGVWLSGGIGLDEGADPDPPGSRVATQTVAPTVTETRENTQPGPTVTKTVEVKITEKGKPAPTVTVTPTVSGKPVTKTVPGPTVTKTGAPKTITVPGPVVTKTGAPAALETVWPQADGVNCIKETQKNGVTHFSAPYPC